MKRVLALALVAAIVTRTAQGNEEAKGTGEKSSYKQDGDDDDSDSDDQGQRFPDICPPQSFFPTHQQCKAGSVDDQDKDCSIRTCIFYPSVGYTVRPSYFDMFNIPSYYRYMFSKQIVHRSPFGGGLGQNSYFPQHQTAFPQQFMPGGFPGQGGFPPQMGFPQQPSFPQPGFPQTGFPQQPGFPQQQPGFPQQQQMGFPQQPSFPGMPGFPQQQQYGQSYPPYTQSFPGIPNAQSPAPAYNPFQQQQQSTNPITSPLGNQQQNYPPQSGFPGQSPFGFIPSPPMPPSPSFGGSQQAGFAPPQPDPPADDSKRSLFFPGMPGMPNQFPQQQFGGSPFGQTQYPGFGGNHFGGHGAGANMHGGTGPIIAQFCRSPGTICKCDNEDDCKCSADRPKVCTQKYSDDARYFYVYEWVVHRPTAQQYIQHPHQQQHQQHQQTVGHDVITNQQPEFQTPIVKSGQPAAANHQQGYVPHQSQNGDIDYSQPVQPVQHTQPTGSYQLRPKFLFYQRPSGCDCKTPRPGQFGMFS